MLFRSNTIRAQVDCKFDETSWIILSLYWSHVHNIRSYWTYAIYIILDLLVCLITDGSDLEHGICDGQGLVKYDRTL